MMLRKDLKLATICEMDGGVIEEVFGQALETIVRDIADRPAEGKSRTITLKLHLTPADKTDPNCDHINVQFEVSNSMPKQKSRLYPTAVGKRGKGYSLGFHPDFPSEPDANGIFDGDSNEKGAT